MAFDEEAAIMLKETTKKCAEMEAVKVEKRNEEEAKLRKRAEEIKKAQEEARKEAEEEKKRSASSGGGFGGSMPGRISTNNIIRTNIHILHCKKSRQIHFIYIIHYKKIYYKSAINKLRFHGG